MANTDFAIRAQGLSKCYTLFDHPADRLKQMLMRGRRKYFREFWALRETNFELAKGQVMGLIGRNGAGKSTLLQLVCGTVTPTSGNLEVQGRVSALLELGAGFNPEFSGRENVYVSAAILGLSKAEIDRRYDEIVEFSGIVDFIDQPVKTYSSGMFVRLAFAVATSVDPDILIIDEALSVGDGEFARKSFDRIREMKEAGKTILFCSHSLYQVEAFCDQVLWLDQGQTMSFGDPQQVIQKYSAFLMAGSSTNLSVSEAYKSITEIPADEPLTIENHNKAIGYATFTLIEVSLDGQVGKNLRGRPGENTLSILMRFESDPSLPSPHVGVTLDYGTLLAVTSAITRSDNVPINRDACGRGEVIVEFPKLALRKGEYFVGVYLGCENALHIYDSSPVAATLIIEDPLPDPGLVNLPHSWNTYAGHSETKPDK